MFLDTSGLLCLHHTDEPQHTDALRLFQAAESKLTHGYVLAEFVTLAKVRGLPRQDTLAFATALLDCPDVEVVWVDGDIHGDAMCLLGARIDKAYSLCDAVSFVLMRQRQLTNALTTDHHFEQEGLVRLLRP